MADEELLKDFVIESLDLLDTVEPKLIALQQTCEETGNVDSDTINSIFRLFHSMKGGAGFLDLPNITGLTHSAESLLDLIRSGFTLFKASHIDVFFRSLDLLRRMLANVMENSSDLGFETDVNALVIELNEAIRQEIEGAKAEKEAANTSSSTVNYDDRQHLIENAYLNEEDEEGIDFDVSITQDMTISFVKEAGELVDTFEKALLDSTESTDPEYINTAFRAIHSLKGNCGFMGLQDLESLSHKIETVLSLKKDGHLIADDVIIGIMLSWVDLIRDRIDDVASGGKGNISHIARLLMFMDDIVPLAKLDGDLEESDNVSLFCDTSINDADTIETVDTDDTDDTDIVKVGEDIGIKVFPEESAKSIHQAVEPQAKIIKLQTSKPQQASTPPQEQKAVARQDIRVDLRKLDSLINLVGELVIAEAMVTRHPSILKNEDEGVERAIHQLRRVSRDLQGVAMAVRMIPLATTFQKMVRLAHDLSTKSGKKVDLQLLGGDTEVDKTVIEQISDPLVHIVRNAIDHGLETTAERIAVGKSELGHVSIEGRHEGGEVWIVIKDDGRGLNKDRIVQKAISKGLIHGDGTDLSDAQIFKLIFEPGFSTAEKVTEVSGRGVGMDVVKRDIERLKGRVDVSSVLGQGATFVLRIPLTLAIIEGMLVRVANTCYTIPMLEIRESIRPLRENITFTHAGDEVVRLRDDFIPIVRLNQVLQRGSEQTQIEDGILVIADTENSAVGLLVDEILGQQETVVKGLPEYITKSRGISGCTILGDGQVSLIVDVGALVKKASESY